MQVWALRKSVLPKESWLLHTQGGRMYSYTCIHIHRHNAGSDACFQGVTETETEKPKMRKK